MSKGELEKWRNLNAADVFAHITDYAKLDYTYLRVKSDKSARWNVKIHENGEFEILTTSPKWFDMRTQKGGGGAIDLVMHLCNMDFREAIELLRRSIP